jgi:hypothetical protein
MLFAPLLSSNQPVARLLLTLYRLPLISISHLSKLLLLHRARSPFQEPDDDAAAEGCNAWSKKKF